LHLFDLKSALLAQHALHVVPIYFPIALFLTSAMFDFVAHRTKNRVLAAVAYYNLLAATISCVPVLTTGILARRRQLEGQRIKEILLPQILFALVSSILIWLVSWLQLRSRRGPRRILSWYRLPIGVVATAG
jgi:uncharacterized membrane protein